MDRSVHMSLLVVDAYAKTRTQSIPIQNMGPAMPSTKHTLRVGAPPVVLEQVHINKYATL